ncbi:MAG: xanthine dehydrogenase small subunit [Bacteroidetes bacterium]|nr:MAG: xanthine dehydrogenase small subunit [Bacteroidota bacterium]
MQDVISFVLNGQRRQIRFGHEHQPTDTVLNYLRNQPGTKGVKEGCAEGDCGACTLMLAELNGDQLQYKAVDSCLIFLPMLQGKHLVTVEYLGKQKQGETELHPVQEALVEANGSQCGYCTPGIVMSMATLYKKGKQVEKEEVEDALTGNLCRCTGYKPIIDACMKSCQHISEDVVDEQADQVISLLKDIKVEARSIEIRTEKQQYFQPKTLEEALDLKVRFPDAYILNGATDIALLVTKRHLLLETCIDLSGIDLLRTIEISGDYLEFGASVSLERMKGVCQESFPAMHDLLAVFGSRQIREMATIGGNIGSSSPISDSLPLLFVSEAEVQLTSSKGSRWVNMNDYITGYRQTVRQPDELITRVRIPKNSDGVVMKFYKVSKRKDLDISTASAAFSLQLEGDQVSNIKMAYGGMAAQCLRVPEAEQYLIGKTWERKEVEAAMQMIAAKFTPLSDARSGAEFRTSVAQKLLLKFWSEHA